MYFGALRSLYSPLFAGAVVAQLSQRRYSGWRLLNWVWCSKDYKNSTDLTEMQRSTAALLCVAMVAQISLGVGYLIDWARYGTAGAWALGAALLVSYPLVWAHVVVALAWAWNVLLAVLHPKQAARSMVCAALEWQVRQLRARHKFKVVAVTGSVGKSGTKLAIAHLLAESGLRVRFQAGNYNDRTTVPLVFFGVNQPSIYNVVGWWKALGIAQSEIALPYPYDVVVVELGTGSAGELADFDYLRPELTVVTAVAPVRMESFGSLDAVAAEQLSVFQYSKHVLVNGDDIAGEYLAGLEFTDYSLASQQALYSATAKPSRLEGQQLTVRTPKGTVDASVRYVGSQGAKVALAAVAVAEILGVKSGAITKALPQLAPFSGRMQILDGVKNTTIIDDTSTSSPLAATAALDTLYAAKAKQRIAILGSMNGLGDYSRQAHQALGEYCDPQKLAVVVTIGEDAKKWLAPAARKRGCTVQTFSNPYDAGAYVSGKMQAGAVVLAKGSEAGIFAEEALKPLLADPTDAEKLVRQSPQWLTRKSQLFSQ